MSDFEKYCPTFARGFKWLNEKLQRNKIVNQLLEKGDLDAITKMGTPAIAVLIKGLKNPDRNIRWSAARVLGDIGDKKVVPALIETLKDEEPGVVKDAAEALGKIADASAVPALIEAWDGGHYSVEINISWALREIGKPAVPQLIAALDHKYQKVRDNASLTLQKMKGDAVPALINALSRGGLRLRRNVVEVLKEIQDPSSVPSFIGLLSDKDSIVVLRAVQGLDNIGDKRAIWPLISILDHKNASVRASVCDALGKFKDPSAVPGLTRNLSDRSEEVVMYSAAIALLEIEIEHSGSVDPKAVREELVKFVENVPHEVSGKTRKKVAEVYYGITETIGRGKQKIDMPGEILPGKPTPPKKMFRRRVAYA